MDSSAIGKSLILFGIGIVLLGGILWGGSRLGIPLGKLPGDIFYQKDKVGFYIPIVTCVVVSLALTVIINLFLWIFRK